MREQVPVSTEVARTPVTDFRGRRALEPRLSPAPLPSPTPERDALYPRYRQAWGSWASAGAIFATTTGSRSSSVVAIKLLTITLRYVMITVLATRHCLARKDRTYCTVALVETNKEKGCSVSHAVVQGTRCRHSRQWLRIRCNSPNDSIQQLIPAAESLAVATPQPSGARPLSAGRHREHHERSSERGWTADYLPTTEGPGLVIRAIWFVLIGWYLGFFGF
jgi:hypothetical protein